MNGQALLKMLSDRPIAFHPDMARILGGIKEAVFMCQLLYWTGKGKRLDGFIWKTQAEMEQETALTRYEQEGARKRLIKLGVLEEKKTGIPAKLHYRVKTDVLLAKIDEFYKQDCGKPANCDAENPQSITETTLEITTSPPAEDSQADSSNEKTGQQDLNEYFGEKEQPQMPKVTHWTETVHDEWSDWSNGHFRERDGVSADSQNRIGFLLQKHTGQRPRSDGQWVGWGNTVIEIYSAAGGDWKAIEQGIKTAAGYKPEFRPHIASRKGDVNGWANAVAKAAAEPVARQDDEAERMRQRMLDDPQYQAFAAMETT